MRCLHSYRRRLPQVILLRHSICKQSISRVLFYLLNGHPALMMLFHTSKQIINHLEETEKYFTEICFLAHAEELILLKMPVLRQVVSRQTLHASQRNQQLFSELGYTYAYLKPKLDSWRRMVVHLFSERYASSQSVKGQNRNVYIGCHQPALYSLSFPWIL